MRIKCQCRYLFPFTLKVVAILVLPRLDLLCYGPRVPTYNAAFERVAREAGDSWINMSPQYLF